MTIRRIVTFLIIAPYKYSYLLTYLLTYLLVCCDLPITYIACAVTLVIVTHRFCYLLNYLIASLCRATQYLLCVCVTAERAAVNVVTD